MKKIPIFALLMLFILIALTGCNYSETGQGEFTNGEIVFNYPPDWKKINYKKDAEMASYIEAFFAAPMKAGDFQPNVNLTVHKFFTSPPTVSELIQGAETIFADQGDELGFEDYQNIKQEVISLQDKNAGLLFGEYTIIKSKVRMKTAQLIVPLEDKVYILTVTSELNQWPSFEEEFTSIIDSFSIVTEG